MAGLLSAVAAGALALAVSLGVVVPHSTPRLSPSVSTVVSPDRPTVVLRGADPADFEPGLLIGDERFFNADALDAAAVQVFLETSECQPVEGVDCLADYRESTPDVADVGAGHCAAYEGDEWESAAVIIVGVARACGINPEVLLVMLQKEQSLITRPSPSGYLRAMGYACPDTADCDTEYFGFFNQVYNAAWQFRQYTLFPSERRFIVGQVDIAFNPNAECGAGPVTIANQATANLYNYTPYQPNEAAVANLYGDGDACSAYGNRNFWRIYTDWFGDPVDDRYPKWMGPCITNEAGAACLETFWIAPPER